MDKKFTFNLEGRQLLNLYILFFIFYFLPLAGYGFLLSQFQEEEANPLIFVLAIGLFLFAILSALVLTTPLMKKVIESIALNEENLAYEGTIDKFMGINIGGALLSMITFGIYGAWYYKNLYGYVIGKTGFKKSYFKFHGTGLKLFGIIILSLFIPMILFMIIRYPHLSKTEPFFQKYIWQAVFYIIIVPYFYLACQWFIDISYNNYYLKWNAKFINSCGVILREMLLTIITFGIYYPAAIAQLYDYFLPQCYFEKEGVKKYRINVELNVKELFLKTWGVFLLSVITLGFYAPWGYCKIVKIYVENTTLDVVDWDF